MIQVISDYDGYQYTVCPCWVSGDRRLYFCGHYAVSGNSWRRVMELKPKLSKHVAWEDLEAYIDDISSKAVEREEKENERKATP